ncbi:AAA family ATPase [Pedobacter sp. Leaf250]|uniref:AAA family ATPase n=1 Tax=Pedobacter sp. Leaf250 TaxID=2876559 RepID=UPI001E657C8B|nr:AAA family ATPase [Pedobacter sp. Leaf250]
MKQLYIRRLKTQDKRTSGGSNTLVQKEAIDSGMFPTPDHTGINLKFYFNNKEYDVVYAYGGQSKSTDVRLKKFVSIINDAGAKIDDIFIIKKQENDTYEVTFVKSGEEGYSFYEGLLGRGTYALPAIITESAYELPADENFEKLPHNWLIYGAPGTGKSNFIEEKSSVFSVNKKRITFYPDYSYSKFVGSYKPSSYYRNSATGITYHEKATDTRNHPQYINEPVIDYRFVPGPFMDALLDAYKGLISGERYLLIIEELNRANASAVFGEIFQLLDRKKGTSEYRVRLSDEAMNYLAEQLREETYQDILSDLLSNGLYIPSTLYIWSTMNSADQGVFPLDSAFKRRWEIKYLPLNANEDKLPAAELEFGGKKYKWNNIRRAINHYLIKKAGVAEDRLIAPFFLSPEQLSDTENLGETFKSKVLLYLKDDILRHKKGFFNEENSSISAIDDNFHQNAYPEKSYDFFALLSAGSAESAAEIILGEYDRLTALEKAQESPRAESAKAVTEISEEANDKEEAGVTQG